jgi:hypothetical protein
MTDSFKPKDSEIKASMHDFEAALTANRADLPVLQPLQKILVVLDGLNQSAMVLGLAAELASRHGSALLVGYVYVGLMPPSTRSAVPISFRPRPSSSA